MATLPLGLDGDGRSNGRLLVAWMRKLEEDARLSIEDKEAVVHLGDYEGRGTTLSVALRRWGQAVVDDIGQEAAEAEVLRIETQVQEG